MEYLPINDLPNELLELIFDHLDVDDLKHASLVCKRWSHLAFTGRRTDRVTLVLDFPSDEDFLQTNRKYRHLRLVKTEKLTYSAHVKEFFQAFNVSSLRIKNSDISYSSLRSILLEVPNLQYLSIRLKREQMNTMAEPLPVMRELEYLEIDSSNPDSALPWHTIAPSLQGLKMYCDYEDQLEQWSLFSGQLKQVYVTCYQDNLLDRFFEMTFPLLEELSVKSTFGYSAYQAENEFFRRNTSLRLLHLGGIYLSETLVQDITNHNKKLTSLEIIGAYDYDRDHEYEDNGEEGSLESLAQLTELKHLRLQYLNTCTFRGCEALTSLQSLCMNKTTFNGGPLHFLRDLFKIAPQLRCLELGSVVMAESDVLYICNNFSKLTRLQLTYSEGVTRNGLSGIDRLPLLRYLELRLYATNTLSIPILPQTKVRCLTLQMDYVSDEPDLLLLPESFPQLDRLNLINWCLIYLRESTVDRLRQLLPTCAIKTYGHLISNTNHQHIKKCISKWPKNEMIPVWDKEWIFKYRCDVL